MNFKTLLVPLDGSAVAEAALPYAETIARAAEGTLYLIAVADVVYHPILRPGVTTVAWLASYQLEQLGTYLHVTAAAVQGRGVPCTVLTRKGRPTDEILAAAEQMDADAIVLASHGRGGVKRTVLGSVANAVARTSPRPVLVVHPPSDGLPSLEGVSLQRIMVPLDGSALAEAALSVAADLAKKTGSKLYLVRVEPDMLHVHAGYEFIPDFEYPTALTLALARTYLTAAGATLGGEVPYETIVREGSPPTELQRFAVETGVGLTILTTHGYGGWRRLVFGSTADRLVRAGLSILLVPPGRAEDTASHTRSIGQMAR
jgi:nucleotide-binding universal stress UspA family protein